MVTIFNRKELLTTHDMGEYARVRDLLIDNGIQYDFKVVNLEGNMGGGQVGYFGRGEDLFMYTLYVRDKDMDEAVYLMNKKDW